MSGYGEVVRETAAEAHERKVDAIAAVLYEWGLSARFTSSSIRAMAAECLAAAEAGF